MHYTTYVSSHLPAGVREFVEEAHGLLGKGDHRNLDRLFRDSDSAQSAPILMGLDRREIERIRTGAYGEEGRRFQGVDVFFGDPRQKRPTPYDSPFVRLGFPLDDRDRLVIRAGPGRLLWIDDAERVEGLSETDRRHSRLGDIVGNHPRQLHIGLARFAVFDTDLVTWRDVRLEVLPASELPIVVRALKEP
jgi:hypothetical protein